ncbi:MAG: hypothetical protein Q8R00_03650 [Candidatus Nanoarchaeia archaeon]|nr:hypothetical protein [Candidatus Nanoarchaeia archaeon]
MNKRGVEERTIIYIAFMIFAAIIIVTLFGKINGEAKGEVFHQTYISRDIAMAINLYDTGKVTVYYPMKYEFNVAVAEGTVAVRKETPVLYSYAPTDYNINIKKIGSYDLEITKI